MIKKVGIFFLGLAMLIGGGWVYLSWRYTDLVFIDGAEMVAKSFPEEIVESATVPFPASLHRIQKGQGTVLAYRYFSPGAPITIDDEQYKKVTVWFPAGLPENGKTVEIGENSPNIAFFSRGGSAWPKVGCHGIFASGSISVIKKNKRSIKVKIRGRVKGKNRGKECGPVFEISETFSNLPISELTPWIGQRAKHVYEETYRRGNREK